MASIDCPEVSCYQKTRPGPASRLEIPRAAYDMTVRIVESRCCQGIVPSSCMAMLDTGVPGHCGRRDPTIWSACNVCLVCTYAVVRIQNGGQLPWEQPGDIIAFPESSPSGPARMASGLQLARRPTTPGPVKLGCLESYVGD